MRRAPAAISSLLVGCVLGAASAVAAQETHLLVVAGLGGGDEFTREFLDQGLQLRTAAIERYGVAPGNAVLLTEDPSMHADIAGESRLEDLEAAFAAIGSRAGPDDRVLVVLLGHGTYRNSEARFNLPGPDITPAGLEALIEGLPTRRVAVVNAASASAPFVPALAGPGRTVIAATSTGREQNRTRFGEYFAAAFADDAADLDKNGSISLLEAFTFARTETARSYEEEGLLMTEHAVLDDDGDGQGTREPTADTSDGILASAFVLGVPGAVAVAADSGRPEAVPADSTLARLHRERAALEQRVAELRRQREEMEPAEYDRRLEELLLELALKSREIRDREGGEG